MNTTDIFVELLIIGIQTFAWIIIFILAYVDSSSFIKFLKFLEPWAAAVTIAFIAGAYTIGLIFDRFADAFFIIMRPFFYSKPLKILFKSSWIKNRINQSRYNGRMKVLIHEGKAIEFLDYIRSRLRIVRATFLNILLLVIALLFLLHRVFHSSSKTIIIISSSGLIVIIGIYWAWAMLQLTYEDRLKQACQICEDVSKSNPLSKTTQNT